MGNLATISGVALVPGVSRNNRLYTSELIKKAAARMQERLADPAALPIVMRTHHDAGDDSAKIVGRITSVTVDNESALRYKADLYDTFHGREIAGLVTPKNPALRSVSIHGYWMGDPKTVSFEGGQVTTADDLEIDAIDFTATPGIDRALIDNGGGKTKESADGTRRTPISESTEATVTLLEEATGWADITHTVPKEGIRMRRGRQYELDGVVEAYWVAEAKYSADDMKALLAKGHAMKNASGEPSYPIKDVSDLKKAIRAVGRGKAGHDAIRKHIIKRAKALGQAGLIPDNWNSDGTMKESAPVRYSDIKEYYPDGPSNPSGFCIDAYSGPLSVTVRGCVPPDDLRAAAAMAVKAAMDAINCMDPDDDADIDADDDDMGEQGTAAVGGVIPDDDMRDAGGESAPQNNATMEADVTPEQMRTMIAEAVAEASKLTASMSVNEMRKSLGLPPLDADGAVAEANMTAGEGHSHTHDGTDAHTHAHHHVHEADAGGDDYAHSHTHSHVHGAADGPSHEHGHNHVHMTSPSATAETTEGTDIQMEESAMGDTQKAAEAAPTRNFTDADMTALGETIGKIVGEAMRAAAETTAPKHAAATQETAETAAPVETAEAAPVVGTPKAELDVDALKESLAKELRKELRDELRNEFLKENGLPPRRGYRVGESEEEVQMTDAELFDKHRVDMLLGMYAKTPAPGDAA